MQTQELIVYLFIVGAFLAVGWMFISRDGDEMADLDHEVGWAKLPLVFLATWAGNRPHGNASFRRRKHPRSDSVPHE